MCGSFFVEKDLFFGGKVCVAFIDRKAVIICLSEAGRRKEKVRLPVPKLNFGR